MQKPAKKNDETGVDFSQPGQSGYPPAAPVRTFEWGEEKMERCTLPKGWKWRALAEVCKINPVRPHINRGDEAPTSFVPMQAVDGQTGAIIGMQIRPYGEVKRGYTYFEENDVLMAKIMASMVNGKVATARGLIGGIGFGTTEFHVLRPNSDILPEWIFFFIRQQSFLDKIRVNFRGTVGRQRLPEDFLKSQEIPLPYPDDPARSLAEQRRIVARLETMLEEVREMRDLIRTMRAQWDELMQSALGEVFPSEGQPLPEGWGWKKLGDECKTTSGGTPRRSNPEYFSGSIPWLKSGELNDELITTSEEYITQQGLEDSNAKIFPRGTVLIAMYGVTVGKLGILGIEATTNQAICAIFTPNHILNQYLFWFLRSARNFIVKQGFGGAQPNINQIVIKKLMLPIPYPADQERSLAEQRRIVAYLDAVQAEVNAARKALEVVERRVDDLEQSILATAFRGEL